MRLTAKSSKQAASTLDVDGAGFVQRMIETYCGGGVNDASCLRAEALIDIGVQPAIGLAHVTRVDLYAGPVADGDKRIGALLTGLARPIADEQCQRGIGLAIQKFAYQLHAEKAGRAGYQDQLIGIH